MTRTFGHKGSQHSDWSSRPSHSSQKEDKADAHKRERCSIRNTIDKLDYDDIGADIKTKSTLNRHWYPAYYRAS